MEDEIELLCSGTRLHNDPKKLKDIFLSRFKLSDEFWEELFASNCPEGIVNCIVHTVLCNCA